MDAPQATPEAGTVSGIGADSGHQVSRPAATERSKIGPFVKLLDCGLSLFTPRVKPWTRITRCAKATPFLTRQLSGGCASQVKLEVGMRQLHLSNALLIALFPFLAVTITSAVTPDPRLLSLVPPGAQVVAGMSAPSVPNRPASYLLVTPNNRTDFLDFISLSGIDDSRIYNQIILVAAADERGILTEHSLLASGHFDQARIFKAAVQNGASISEFKGIPVLVLQPLERNRGTSKEVRWLAVIESNVAVFGTIASVQQELDRHLDHSAADLSLRQRLARLRRDDETWCVLAAFVHNYETRRALGSLDASLIDPAHDGDAFQFGIHYGRRIEFEYEITAASSASARATASSLSQPLAGPANGSSLLASPDMTGDGNTVRGVIKVSKTRYSEWLVEVSARRRMAAASH